MEHKGKKPRNSLAAQEAQRRREERRLREQEAKKEAKLIAEQKQRRKQAERKARDSRAAQTAQRQRQERVEDNRLDELRQKQHKEAKQRTRKRISPLFWKRLIIMAAISLTVVLLMVIFFRVQHIEVEGNLYYDAEEIAQVCGLETGDNLLTISRSEIAGNVMAHLDYVKSVQVTRRLPNRVTIKVTEYPATYAVMDTAGSYYLITAQAEAMEAVDEKEARKHILIRDLCIITPVIGDTVSIAAEEGQESSGKARLNSLTALLQALEAADLVKETSAVSVAAANELVLWYTDRFEVSLGGTSRLDYKLEFLKEVVAQQKTYATGTIDLTLSQGDAARVNLNE